MLQTFVCRYALHGGKLCGRVWQRDCRKQKFFPFYGTKGEKLSVYICDECTRELARTLTFHVEQLDAAPVIGRMTQQELFQ